MHRLLLIGILAAVLLGPALLLAQDPASPPPPAASPPPPAAAAPPPPAAGPPPPPAAAPPPVASPPPPAQGAGTPDPRMAKVGEVLVVFLVLSVVFEVALTPIFNWRVFLARFDGKGIKTPLTILVAMIVFWSYELDIIRDLLVALGYTASLSFGGQFVTSLLIAGGSDGVFRIFTRLGIRNPQEREQKAEAARRALEESRKPNS